MFWPHLTLTIYFDLTWPRQYTLTSLDLHNIFWLVDSFDLYSFWLGLSRLIFFVLMVLFLALFRLKISILFYCSSLHFDTDIYMVSDFLDNFPVAWSYLYVTMVVPRMSFGTQVVSFQWKFSKCADFIWCSIGCQLGLDANLFRCQESGPQFLSYGVWLQLQDMIFSRSNHGLVMLFSHTWLGLAWPLLWITALGNLTPEVSKTTKLEKVSFLLKIVIGFLKWLCFSVFSKIKRHLLNCIPTHPRASPCIPVHPWASPHIPRNPHASPCIQSPSKT